MSSDIETRILEMKLDNDQFEKGVKSTIQSLEELEEKLELKDAADGFDKVSKAANTMQFSSMERSLDAITDKFSLLGNVGLQALTRISNKIVDIGENIIKGITVDPIMDGWQEFEMKTNSIQTIFGGIGKNYPNDAAAFRAIGQELDQLNQYADQTIYSFAQMTENVGKFTNQNIGLKTATKAIKGIGNWAALVGADPTQMSRAMYNISQSLGSGSMQLIDWKSIRFANMATPDVKQLFADIALMQGGMRDKKGNLLKKGSKAAQQAYQAILSDFEGSLKTGWLTNDLMMKAFGVLSGDLQGMDLLGLFGDTEEGRKMAEYYAKIAEQAAKAATQVKTFTQLVDVLKESLGSGWATSFEKLFGGFQKQIDFFTKISEIIGGYIDRDAEARNSWIDKFTLNNGGTEKLLGFFENLISLLTEVWGLSQVVTDALISPFNGAYWFGDKGSRALFGGLENNLNDTGLTAQHVAGVIGNLNIILERLHDWFHGDRVLDDGTFQEATPAFENVSKIFAGLGSVIMIALNALEHFGQFVVHVAALFEPLASSILNMFGNVGEVLYSLYQNLAGQQTFRDFFMNLYAVVAPVVNAIAEFLSSVIDLIASLFDLGTSLDETGAMAENNKLGPFIKTISDIFKTLPIFMAPVTGFLTRIVAKITDFVRGVTKGFPAIKKHVKREGVTPFEDLKDIVQEFIAAGFGEETAKAITDWYNNNVKGTFASLVDWFGKAYDSITTFFQELPGKVTKLVERVKAAFNAFQNYNYNDALSPYQNFKDRMQEVIYALFGKEVGDKIVKAFKENIEPKILEVAGAIESAFSEVKRVLNGLAKVFTSDYTDTENPFDILQAIALNFLEGYDEGSVDPNAATRKSSVLEFFKNLEESYDKDIKPVIDKVTGWATKDIPQAFDTISGYLFGKEILVNKGEGGLAHLEKEHVPGMFERILAWINGEGKAKLEEITSFFSSTWTSITDAIFGYDTTTGNPEKRAKRQAAGGKTHVDGLVDVLLGNVKSAYEKITGWIDGEGNALWQTATDFFFGEVDAETKKRSGGAIQAIVDWYNEHSAEIEEIFTVKIPVLFGQIRTALFGGQQSVLIGENKDGPIYELQHVDSIFKPVEDWINGDGKAIFDEVIDFFENAWEQLNHVLFGYDDAIDPEGTAVEHIPGLFENLKKWAEDDGTKIWTEITDFIFGKSVTDKAGNVTREGGVFPAIQTFLDPIIDWIKKKGSWLYDYVTTHSFSEMWAKLGELFAGQEVLDAAGKPHFEGGYFSELINVLRPISDFIGRVGNSLYEKVNSIDFIELWRKIGELLYGYDEYGLVNEGSGDTYYETKHIDGLFDKIGAFFDRVTAFFESDTWKGIKETIERVYTQYIKPTFDFLGGGLGTLFQYNFDKGFFENFGSNFENLSGYLTTEFPKLLEKWFPEGFDLSSVVGNLVPDWLSNLIPEDWKKSLENFLNGGSADGGAKGGSASSKPPTGESAQSALMRRFGLTGKELIGSNLFSDVVGLYGSYNERLAEGKAEVESAQKESTDKTESFETDVTKTVDQFAENRDTVRDTLHSILKTIGDFLGTLFGGAGQIGTMIFGTIALSNVSDTVQALTGHQKDSFIQDIADLFEAIGGFLGNMALLIGVGAASSYVDHIIEADETAKEQTDQLEDGESKTQKLEERISTIDHIFNKVYELLRNIILIVASIAAGSYVGEIIGDNRIDAWRDKHGMNYGSDTTSIAENIQAIGEGIQAVASTVGVFMESLFKMVALEALVSLLDNSFFAKGEKTLSTSERMDVLIQRAVEIMGKLGAALGTIMSTSLSPLLKNNFWNSIFGIGVNLATAQRDASGKITASGMKSRFDSYSSTLLAVGSLMESFAGALGTVLTTLSLSELFADFSALDSKLTILERVAKIFTDLLGAVSGIILALSAKDVTNSIQGLNIDLPWLKGKFNGAENTHAAGGLGIGTYAKLFGFTTLLGVLVLALSETAMVIMEKHLASASSTIMVAASQIQAVIEAVSRLTPEQTGNAVGALESVTKMFTEMGKWTEASEYTVKQSMHFRDVLINASMGFEAISKGLTGFDEQTMIGAFESIGKIMEYIKGEQGFDPAEFQGKMSFMQLAGQNFQSTVEAFRYITIGDIGQLAIVKIYFEAFQEIAEILSAIGSLGNFGAGFMAFDSGFNAYSFIEFLAQVRTLSGRDDLKYAFEQIIEALPDSPELLQKLRNFSNSGGGSLGLFTSGIMGLTGALRGYQEVMEKIGTQNFTDQANALDKIDKLGASLGEKDFNAIGELNANTRLGLFANDVKTLAAGLKELAIVKTDGSEYDFESLGTFFERLNRIGVIIDGYGNPDIGDGFSVFVTQFQSLQTGFSSFIETLSSEKFDKEKLDVTTDFLNNLAAIGGAIPQEMIHLLNRKTFLPDDRNEVTQINSEKLAEFLTNIGTALPTIGTGVASFNKSIHDSGIILTDNQTAEELKVAADFIEQIARAASYMNEGIKLVDFSSAGAFIYTFNELANDLWREDGTGLFNVMAKIFDFANSEEFDATGMRLANEAFSSFGGFAQGLSALLNTGSNISEGQAGGLGSAVEKLFKEGIYGSIQSMPITELQSYAAAFSDLSNALAMNGQTATLVTAIDQAIEALKDKEIQITVTPVWKDGSLAGDLNAPSMTVTPNVTNTYSAATIQNITFPDVQAVKLVPEDVTALTNATRDAATTVSGRVDTMSNTIGGLRVQLDTGVLVGYLVPAINRRMGRDYSNPRYIPVFDYTSEP